MSAPRAARALGLALAAALAGCEARAHPPACPGAPVATLVFSGQADKADGGICPSVDGGLAFTGTLSYTDTQAYLCLDRLESAPLAGDREGDHLTLKAPPAPATLDACGCPLTVVETLEGDLLRSDGGVTGFSGQLSDDLAPPDGGTAGCEKDGGTACGVPCTARWTVTGAP
ncbi:hypothetical protein [Anaeromyxobacter diazotrophicus]|uniref:Lipoprotein n=1 Tax=Anaeromyxobacter diazotrophicus TaxID=2590199 RepID=A0A7I9VL77_9BACT|nr:hypothetical protein [Anaeromyxobacter diazotrophicus]GEJ56737.1 hypothetical protein AMYX_14780 [Anaeromyxobacter diazotrophicus]